ncbi:MAG: hypothetical protein ACK500_06930 [Flavobacteriales bacterium]
MNLADQKIAYQADVRRAGLAQNYFRGMSIQPGLESVSGLHVVSSPLWH